MSSSRKSFIAAKRTAGIALALALALTTTISACGDGPSLFLRQGRFPISNFPLYVAFEGDGIPAPGDGGVLKCTNGGSCQAFASNIGIIKGIAVDSFHNVYVVDSAGNRVLKIKQNKEVSTLISGLNTPSFVAVDSFGEVYVNQEGARNIIRARDSKVIASFATLTPTAFAFGVDDQMVICFGKPGDDKVQFGVGSGAPQVSITSPVGVTIDDMGRIYISQDTGVAGTDKIFRFDQKLATTPYTFATGLTAPKGMAIDPAQNILYAKSTGTVQIVEFSGFDNPNPFTQGLEVPSFVAFEKY
jgi:DNA-binding beta-propeller fold protein YncE